MLTPEAEFANLTAEQVIAGALVSVAPPSTRGEA
jgi:hypothetical protein